MPTETLTLQDQLDRLNEGEALTLKPREEVKGPIVIRKRVVIIGHGGTIWAPRGPVVRIEAAGVMLRDVNVEVTARDAGLEGEAGCALVVDSMGSVSLDSVTVRGNVLGLDKEEGVWRYPRTLALGALKANTPHEFTLILSAPAPCSVETDIDGLHIKPREIEGDVAPVTLRMDALAAGTRLRGTLTLKSAYLARRISVSASAADDGQVIGRGQVVWKPEGVADPNPPEPVPDLPLEQVDAAPRSSPVTMRAAPSVPDTSIPAAPRTLETGNTIVVSPFETGQCRSITDAIKQARAGMKIVVRPGVYAESLVIDRRVEIVGDGPTAEIVVESPDGNCLRMQTDLSKVRGLTLRGAARRTGRDRYAVYIPQGRLILEDCRITSDSLACVAVCGAGTAPVLRRCTIRDGRSAGVVVYDKAELLLEECEIGENTLAGVESRTGAKPTLRRCRLDGGRAAGVLVHDKGEAVLEDCEISGHALAGVESRRGGHPVLRRCTIREGKSVGLRVAEDGLATLEDCEIRDHPLFGVEARQGGNPFLRRCKLHRNKQAGALFHRDAKGTLEECDVIGSARAGVEVRQGADPMLRRCTIHECDEMGVAFRDRAKGTMEDCEVFETGLAAVEARQNSVPVLKRCKIHDSRQAGIVFAGRSGGTMEECEVYACGGPGVAVARQSNPTLRRCKVRDNALGGVVVWGDGQGTLERCEVADNGLSGVAVLAGGAPNVRMCAVTGNAAAGVWAARGAGGAVENCNLSGNRDGALDIQGGATLRLTGNKDGTA